ncbi:hypothetical protein J1614_011674 [Plenodomus biglobosus]|nr:hypothetical protein J1614_011674 [Plenodomus biglobosus]
MAAPLVTHDAAAGKKRPGGLLSSPVPKRNKTKANGPQPTASKPDASCSDHSINTGKLQKHASRKNSVTGAAKSASNQVDSERDTEREGSELEQTIVPVLTATHDTTNTIQSDEEDEVEMVPTPAKAQSTFEGGQDLKKPESCCEIPRDQSNIQATPYTTKHGKEQRVGGIQDNVLVDDLMAGFYDSDDEDNAGPATTAPRVLTQSAGAASPTDTLGCTKSEQGDRYDSNGRLLDKYGLAVPKQQYKMVKGKCKGLTKTWKDYENKIREHEAKSTPKIPPPASDPGPYSCMPESDVPILETDP